MMKRLAYIALALIVASSCLNLDKFNPYEGDTHNITVSLIIEEGTAAAGISVNVEDIMNGNRFKGVSDEDGRAVFSLVNGLYRISVNCKIGQMLYNGTLDRVKLSGQDESKSLLLSKVVLSDLVIKEIYCGGCKKLPQEGDYQFDKYITLHNNSDKTVYLDDLCVGMYSPYNSNATTNPWVTRDTQGNTVFRDFIPTAECIWQFPGDGKTHPLTPGEDAVIAVNGAIDHTAQYPLSVNLNNEKYFVCYNTTYFQNTSYHPAPGDKIRQDHILNVVKNVGQSTGYPLSINSPAVFIFRSEGMSVLEFTQQPGSVQNIPGSQLQVICVPLDWAIDAVEVFNGKSSANNKRVAPKLDAGYVTLSGSYMGHSLVRKTDLARSEEAGYEVLVDTNNSSEDFYESPTALLHIAGEGASDE